MKTLVYIPFAAIMLAGPALAQDDGLYAAVADPNTAYVRVIGPDATTAVVQNVAFNQLTNGISPYVPITGGDELVVSAMEQETRAPAAPGTFTTVLVSADGSGVVLPDTITKSPAQADLIFYNMSDIAAADLYVPAASAVAVPAVASEGSGAVALRAPLTLDFEAREGDTVLASISGIALERREGMTIVLRGTGGAYELVAMPNQVAN